MMHLKFLVVYSILVSCVLFAADKADRYEAIAAAGLQKHKFSVDINDPEELPDILLESTQSNPALPLIQYDRMDNREEFQAELQRLKKRYEPFLQDKTPAQPVTRSRLDLKKFKFRKDTQEDRLRMTRIFNGDGQWENVTVPHYTGPLGWWRGYYRKEFEIPEEILEQEVQILHFGAVSYECDVYLNGRMVGSHVGWFSPFEIDVTEFINREGKNTLVVEIRNEPPPQREQGGKKIFAATSPGWDDPIRGWHCDQSGGGIWQEVYLEGCPKIHISDIFVRPNIDEDYIDVIVELYRPPVYMLEDKGVKIEENVDLCVSIYPKNFDGEGIENIFMPIRYPVGACYTEYLGRIKMENYKLWQLDTPYLYSIVARVSPKNKSDQKDVCVSHFGMRKFHIDTDSTPKGTLYLNNEEVLIRGANHMGHLQREVMEGDLDQVIEDILIAKMANINYWRFTQDPCQSIVYDYCDKLGIMTQTDLPLFGQLSRWALEEAIKQAGEMEKLVRNHPCNVMITYINETNGLHQDNRCYLNRDELDEFFKAASAVVHTHNPDRLIKPIDGDFYPPPPGLPDLHAYSLWYGAGLSWGKLHRGYSLPGKSGWKWAMGEYGIEGLEAAETMFQYYPKDWLPIDETAPWNPDKISLAQAWRIHLAWYETQDNMRNWIEASQAYQAWAVRAMTRDLRRHKDNTSSVIHLLIDAWPAGWMKTLVDVNRIPKKSYYEYRDALNPLIADIRLDRTRYFGGDYLDAEFWICNDRKAMFDQGTLVWELWDGNTRLFAQSKDVSIPAYDPAFCGYFTYKTPKVEKRKKLTIKLALYEPDGRIRHATEESIEIFPRINHKKLNSSVVGMIVSQDPNGMSYKITDSLGLKIKPLQEPYSNADMIFVDNLADIESNKKIIEYVKQGGKTIVLEQPGDTSFNLDGYNIVYGQFLFKLGREFVSRKTGHSIVNRFEPQDFGFWYNPQGDYIDYIILSYMDIQDKEPELSMFSADAMKFNFGISGSKVKGYTLTSGDLFDEKLGYGWDKDLNFTVRKRGKAANQVLDTAITIAHSTNTGTFSVNLENGDYYVTPIGGDPVYPSHFEVYAEDQKLCSCELEVAQWTTAGYRVKVEDGRLDVKFVSNHPAGDAGLVASGLVIEKWDAAIQGKVTQQGNHAEEKPFFHILQTGSGETRFSAVGELKLGQGSFIFCQLRSCFDVSVNPIYGKFWQNLIEY